MPYSSENYLDIFNKVYEENTEEKIESLRKKGIFSYRVKTIKSGSMLELEIYPLWRGKIELTRAKKELESRKAQKNLNDKNSKKNLIRKINTNFTEKDLAVDLTYKGTPPDEVQAKKDIQNYILRLKRYRKKNGLPDLKYIYVIEFNTEETKKKRIHHHMIINDMDRDVVEKLWNKGYANSRRLQPNEFGLEGIARYISKDPRGNKRWCSSRNLKEPKITIADTKISRRQVEKLARGISDPEVVFEKLHKGYIFNDIDIKYSDFVAGAYLYARLRLDDKYKKVNKERWT